MGLRKSTSRSKTPADELERRVTSGASRTCRPLYLCNRRHLYIIWCQTVRILSAHLSVLSHFKWIELKMFSLIHHFEQSLGTSRTSHRCQFQRPSECCFTPVGSVGAQAMGAHDVKETFNAQFASPSKAKEKVDRAKGIQYLRDLRLG